MRILAIETSCDETGISLVEIEEDKRGEPKIKVLQELVSSQIKIHAPFGGVVPSLAKREHQKNLPILLEKILYTESDVKSKKSTSFISNSVIQSIDLIAVTVGPGLEPALWTGIEFAKEIAKEWEKPLVGVNHLHGHMYSFLLSPAAKKISTKDIFPAIMLLVSGGHTTLALMKNLHEYKKLGETLDDAVGESFDKVARLLDLPYPGGPQIEKLATEGNPEAIAFPSPMLQKQNFQFSYSGLKTAVLYYVRGMNGGKDPWSIERKNKKNLSRKNLADIAASFQRAAFLPLVKKTMRAVKEYQARTIMIGGGVAANKELGRMLKSEIKKQKTKVSVITPPIAYCMDNATMIALAAYMRRQKKKKYPLRAKGTLDI